MSFKLQKESILEILFIRGVFRLEVHLNSSKVANHKHKSVLSGYRKLKWGPTC